MWHRLSLRTRILLGYGVGLLILSGLVALLLIRLEQINTTMVSLNGNSAAEAQIGARLAGQAALVQQAVNRYFQQPQEIYRQQAEQALDAFKAEIAQQRLMLTSGAQQARAADLASRLADLAFASLKLAQARLRGLMLDSHGDITLDDALEATTLEITATGQLADNLKAMRQLRSTQLVERSDALQRSADAIAQGALATLTEATADLEREMRNTEQAAVIALLGALAVTVLMGIQLARTLTKPLNDLVAATGRINQGDYDQPVVEREGGEVGRLVIAFNQMTATLRQQRAEVTQQHALMSERNCELEQTLNRLQRATAERETLASTVQSLSVPVIPILEQVIVVPLVGELDHDRAQLLLQRLLAGVVSQRARMVILDITGLAMIDSLGATWLLRAASAIELLGARTILAGTSPEVAQALVASGADLSHLHTSIDLRAAVEFALRRVDVGGHTARN